MTDSRFARFCAALVEGGWLAAIVTTPLFFNVYSDRIFEEEKTAVLRSITLLMAVAWLAAWAARQPWQARDELLARWQSAARTALRNQYPLLLSLLLLVVAYLLALAFSVDRQVSWLGSYRRAQGVYTLLAYATIFAITATSMRTRAQLERAITLIILTTIPITLYAGLQRYDLDPMPWSGGWQVRVQLRVIGHMGHPIFVAAYLMMGFLLTAVRWLENVWRIAYSASQKAIRHTPYAILSTFLYSLILLLQLLAILWSGSRGPLLGLAAGIALFIALLVALLRQAGRVSRRVWRRLSAVATVAAVLLLAGLVLFNLPAGRTAAYRGTPVLGGLLSTMDRWRDHPTIGRFGRLLEVGTGSGRVRVLIWQGMVDLVRPREPIPFSSTETDPYNALRPLFGYGPDTLYLVYNRFYQPEIASLETRNTGIDRAHNETLDVLAFTGLAGLLAWQGLFLGLLAYGLRCLGLLAGRRDLLLLVGLWLLAGLLLAFAVTAWPGLPYIGVAFPAGNLLGLFLYLLYSAARGQQPTAASAFSSHDRLLIVGLLAAIMAHYVEIQFGIAVVATRTLFFLLAALLLVIGHRLAHSTEAEPAPAPEPAPRPAARRDTRKVRRPSGGAIPAWLGPILAYALPIGLLTAVVAYEFILLPAGLSVRSGTAFSTASEIIRRAWLTQEAVASPYVFLLILATWLLSVILTLIELTIGHSPLTIDNSPPSPNHLIPAASFLILVAAVPLGVLVGPWAGLLLTVLAAAVFYSQWDSLRHHPLLPAGLLAWFSLAIGLAFPYFHALQLYAASFTGQAATIQEQVNKAVQPSQFLTAFYLFALGMIFLFALTQLLSSRASQDRGPAAGWLVCLGLLPLAFYAIYQSNLRPNQADIVYKQARTLDVQAFQSRQPALLDQAIAVYEKTIEMAPDEPFYRSFLGLAYLQKASITADLAAQELLWRSAEDHLLLAAAQLPLNPEYRLNLARLYATRARLDGDANPEGLLATAHDHYSAALNFSPRNGAMWNEYANVVYNLQEDCQQALSLYQASGVGDPFYAKTYVEISTLMLTCDPAGLTTDSYEDILATLRYALYLISTGTTPEEWERLAQQYNDLATFEAALATYEQERSQRWLQTDVTLDEAEAALAAGDLSGTNQKMQDSLALLRQLVAQ